PCVLVLSAVAGLVSGCGRGGVQNLQPIRGCTIDGSFIPAFDLADAGLAIGAPCDPVCNPAVSTSTLTPLGLNDPCGVNRSCYWDPVAPPSNPRQICSCAGAKSICASTYPPCCSGFCCPSGLCGFDDGSCPLVICITNGDCPNHGSCMFD